MRPVVVVAALVAALATSPAVHADDDELAGGVGMGKLVDALRASSSFKVRATAAVALGRMGDPKAAPALEDALRSDDHYAVRVAAAAALGRLLTTEGIPALIVAMHDQDQFVREEAQSALDRFHTAQNVYAFRDALESDDAVARLAAVRAYGDVMRENVGLASFVVTALGDDDDNVQRAAESAISGIPHERAVPLLVGALASGGSEVRAACARLLTKRADKSAVEPLIAIVVAADEGDDVRAAARNALKAHREYIDVPAKEKAAADTAPSNKDARIAALRVVVAVGDAGAPALIDTALKDGDSSVRVAGARAAADLGGAEGKRMLEAAKAKESDPRTQKQIELLLKSVH